MCSTSCLNVAVEFALQAYFLQNGIESLKFNEDPRKRADLLRYIDNMDQPKVYDSSLQGRVRCEWRGQHDQFIEELRLVWSIADLFLTDGLQSQITAVIRIFYLYASLLNVADEAHSHRQRREQVRS